MLKHPAAMAGIGKETSEQPNALRSRQDLVMVIAPPKKGGQQKSKNQSTMGFEPTTS